ncbi:MAG TPA: autotransporter outer membrane beta-barrel domain-containing protein [Candidatus Methylacidiphilales bacterium]|nr:autotransporter outer membrane beta-barrel domain-containing protein [Candidatus Methylacidiphilales bacterium]
MKMPFYAILGVLTLTSLYPASATTIVPDIPEENPELILTPGLTPNQYAVAANLDGVVIFKPVVIPVVIPDVIIPAMAPPTTDIGSIVLKLEEADSQIRAIDLDQLSPQRLQAWHNIAFDNFGFDVLQLDNHLASLRYGQGGLDSSGLQVMDSAMPSGLAGIQSHLLAYNPSPLSRGLVSDVTDPILGGVATDAKDMKEVAPVTEQNRWSTFISGNVILADISSDPDVAHANFTTGSVMAGADYRIDDHWAVGGLVGYGHTDATLDQDGSTTDVDSYSPGIYATYAGGGWYANGILTYDYNSYTENRSIGFLSRMANGSTDGSQYNADLDGGYEFHSGNWTFGPTAALQYVHLDIGGFTEGGANAADLAIANQQDDSLRSRLGGEFRYQTNWWGSVVATPYVSAVWQHEYLQSSAGITSQFAGQGLGSFTINTSTQDRDAALLDAGLDAQLNRALSVFIDYQAQAGQSDFFAQSITAGAKISF